MDIIPATSVIQIGLIRLRDMVASLKGSGRFTDEEGEITLELEALVDALSAAQAQPVAWKWEVLPDSEIYKYRGAKEGVYFEDPKELGILMDHPAYRWTPLYDCTRACIASCNFNVAR